MPSTKLESARFPPHGSRWEMPAAVGFASLVALLWASMILPFGDFALEGFYVTTTAISAALSWIVAAVWKNPSSLKRLLAGGTVCAFLFLALQMPLILLWRHLLPGDTSVLRTSSMAALMLVYGLPIEAAIAVASGLGGAAIYWWMRKLFAY